MEKGARMGGNRWGRVRAWEVGGGEGETFHVLLCVLTIRDPVPQSMVYYAAVSVTFRDICVQFSAVSVAYVF